MMYQKTHKSKMYFLSFILTLAAFWSTASVQAMNGNIEQKLYERVDYRTLFDQRGVLAKFSDFLEQEGLERVVLTSKEERELEGCIKKALHSLTCNGFRKKQSKHLYARVNDFRNEAQSDDLMVKFSDANIRAEQRAKKLEKALVADYKARKRCMMLKALGEPAFSAIVYSSAWTIGSKTIPDGTASGISSLQIIGQLASNITQFTKAFYNIFFSSIADQFEKFEIEYAKRKRFLPPTLQDSIEGKFGIAHKHNQNLDKLREFFEIALNLPLKSKKLTTPLDRMRQFKDLLKGYKKDVAKTIFEQFVDHSKRHSSRYAPLNTEKTVLYLQGPPGMGKTYMTNEISKMMTGQKAITVISGGDAAKVIGSRQDPGELLRLISKPETPRNAIIFIDELDRIVNKKGASLDVFLQLLEPNAEYFNSPFLNARVDISHYCFVMAGNHEITDEALKSRLEVVKIDWMSKQKMKKIIHDCIKKKIYSGEYSQNILENRTLIEEINQQTEAHDIQQGLRDLRKDICKKIRRWDCSQDSRYEEFSSEDESDHEGLTQRSQSFDQRNDYEDSEEDIPEMILVSDKKKD